MKNCNCNPTNCAYPCCMSLRERLAFDRAWSVKIKRPTEVDTDILYQLREDFGPSTADQYKRACKVPTWQGASLYEYGHEAPNYPVPAIHHYAKYYPADGLGPEALYLFTTHSDKDEYSYVECVYACVSK